MIWDRRTFLKAIATAGAAAALPGKSRLGLFAGPADPRPGSFDFVFFTDTHIEPELDAAHGCAMCFDKIASLKPEFAIMGGDHVYDALGVSRLRADQVYDLYKKTERSLGMPLYQMIGNHDAFGVLTKSGVAPADPSYGKKMYEDRIGRTFYSFDHKGYHFVVLDSIQVMADRRWEARVDDAQLQDALPDLWSERAVLARPIPARHPRVMQNADNPPWLAALARMRMKCADLCGHSIVHAVTVQYCHQQIRIMYCLIRCLKIEAVALNGI